MSNMPPTRRRWSLLDAALAYAAAGLPIFPVVPCGKRPLVAHGLLAATCQPAVIRHWWRRWPQANIGLPTGRSSGLVVLDIDARPDPRTGLSGYDGLRQLGPLPPTTLVRTGGGGLHLLYRVSEDQAPVRSTTRLGGLGGVDVRGEGGYIVASPSRHRSGQLYRLVRSSPRPARYPQRLAALATSPVVHLEAQHQTGHGSEPEHWEALALQVARQRGQVGNRNALGYWLACRLVEAGCSTDVAWRVLRIYAASVPEGDHPYTLQEAWASLQSAFRSTGRSARYHSPPTWESGR